MSVLKKIGFTSFLLSVITLTSISAQTNSPFSPNPPAKDSTVKEISKKVDKSKQSPNINVVEKETDAAVIETDEELENVPTVEETKSVSISDKTREVVKKANRANLPLTEIYQVGVGDVLLINLQNTTAKYFTVLVDGTIDYPLAGKLVTVVGLTTDEIEDLLREKIKLYENPQISVRVREYSSHKINIKGMAKTGEYFLQREAIPLVVVKTMVGVDANAKGVVIERENSAPIILSFNNPEADKFLILKGDSLNFESDSISTPNNVAENDSQFYFFGEKVCSGGKKIYHNGLTLVQAIFNACGGMNDKLKEVTILRKDNSGKFISLKYNIKNILQGKESDPIIKAGDMIDSVK